MQDYSIVEQLRKTPAQISLLSLLIHSDEHRKALMKILNEAHVPDKITVNHLEKIANKIFEANRITFSDDELPIEGTEHNRALYLTVNCEDSAISRVLVDNGSSANICPLSTLQKLKIGTERIYTNNVCVRGFNGGGKDSVGDIRLNLSIGPVEFTMEFQVLDVVVSYNLLLGRPWIHATKAIPSSLHQMVKFEWDRQEIVVHGDENSSAYNDTIIPFIEVEDDKGPWVYQIFKTVSVGKIPEGECILGPKIPSASVMVANEMLKNGFLPGKGKDVKKAKSLKGKAWSLPKPVPYISKSFVKSGVAKRPISVVPKPVVNFDKELIKRFQSLFDEVNMVEIGEGSTNADAQLVGPNVKLSNWKATPLPIRKEFCVSFLFFCFFSLYNSFYAGFNDMTCMRNFQPNLKSQSNSEITIQEVEGDDETEYDEEATFEEVSRELKHFEEKPKPNLNETEAINLGDQNNVRETKISVHLEPQIKEEIIKTLFAYKDVFTWSYDDMPGLSTDLVAHKLPTDPTFPPVKQKLRKFKTDMSVKIKEEITKQLEAKVIRVTQYPTWLANVVPVPKKDGKMRVCVDYRDLNKASPKDNFPLPNIHILIDNCAKHEIGSFVDCYAGYHQILMDEEDAEKTTFITPWGTYCYRVMPFGLKNAGATYMRAMTNIFHDMIHKEIEVYVDYVIIKSKKQSDHVGDLRKFFQRLRRYNLKLNPAKCAFGVPSGKLLGFIVSQRGIELDPSKIKAIQELPPPKNKTEVMSLLGRLNYISRFIAQLTTTYEPIFKLLKKNVAVKWTDECQQAFDKINNYLLNPPVLVPPEPGRPLILYLTVTDNSFGRLAKWQILLTEFDIIYVTRTAMKDQALADHLAENPVDEVYEPLKTYFPDEEVIYVDDADHDEKPGWKLFFDGAANMKGVGIGAVLIFETRHHYPITAQLRFYCTNNMAEYEACILGLRLAIDMGVQEILGLGDSDLLVHQIQGEWETCDLKLIPYRQCLHNFCQRFRSIEFRHIPRSHNEIADALATLASMLHHPDKTYVDPLQIQIRDQHAYCNVVEEELDGEPWFHDVKEYIKSGVYPAHATGDQKRTIRRLASRFFLNGGILQERTSKLITGFLFAPSDLARKCKGSTVVRMKVLYDELSVRDSSHSEGKEILFAVLGIPHEENMFQISSVLSF
ncbi:uncharacterized protein [Nicotiana tomentosiformis]|uniref:uncharacterized protein n=1 Tax=Nicotiana tomentosiformis TaxID=4098 RepID=UPI00388C4E13